MLVKRDNINVEYKIVYS